MSTAWLRSPAAGSRRVATTNPSSSGISRTARNKRSLRGTGARSTASADRTYLVLFLVVVVIVQLNILIAIVSDSYDAAMAKSEALYNRSHLELVTETAWAARRFPRRLLPTIDEAWIKTRLAAALKDADDGEDQGRINYTSERTRAVVQADTRRAIAPINQNIAEINRNIAELQEMMQRLLAQRQAD